MRAIAAICALFASTLTSGCVGRDAWTHYDECSGAGSFVRMVECGKKARTAECTAIANCTANGNAVVLYADSLRSSVERGEMSEPEATRRWLEYRTSMIKQKQGDEPTVIVVRR